MSLALRVPRVRLELRVPLVRKELKAAPGSLVRLVPRVHRDRLVLPVPQDLRDSRDRQA